MFQNHQRETRLPVIWNYLIHCSFSFWIIKVSYIQHKKYRIMHGLKHNSNLTKTKKAYIPVKINLEMGKDFQGS